MIKFTGSTVNSCRPHTLLSGTSMWENALQCLKQTSSGNKRTVVQCIKNFSPCEPAGFFKSCCFLRAGFKTKILARGHNLYRFLEYTVSVFHPGMGFGKYSAEREVNNVYAPPQQSDHSLHITSSLRALTSGRPWTWTYLFLPWHLDRGVIQLHLLREQFFIHLFIHLFFHLMFYVHTVGEEHSLLIKNINTHIFCAFLVD